ncbi:MAG: hypothetical protein IJ806_10410 [Ruminococcus sp.]|nr:hypothetical protein [Ruminococcus sp.]
MDKTKQAAVLAAVMMLTWAGGCGKTATDTEPNVTARKLSAAADRSETESSATDSGTDDSTQEQQGNKKKPAQADVGNNGAKAVKHVMLIPEEDKDISRDVRFTDLYGRNVLHSEVVGLVGAPVQVDFDPAEVNGGRLVFIYDPAQLNGVRPDALMFMWYDEDNYNYQELTGEILDTENCGISIKIDDPGTYLLVNRYTWFNCWGAGLEDDGLEKDYDPAAQPIDPSAWEKYCYTGQIKELADEEYIKNSRTTGYFDYGEGVFYDFKVTTPEELASAVYFVNCVNDQGGEKPQVAIELENDIDLEGYEWAPMGWSAAGIDYEFTGFIQGNGHTIKNMAITDDFSYSVGFIGKAYYANIYDLHFENAVVSGSNAGVIIGYDRWSYLQNCSCTGTTSGNLAGTMVGYSLDTEFGTCEEDVTANGEKLGRLSFTDWQRNKVANEHEITETIWFNEEGLACREEGIEDKYHNLSWRIKFDGEDVLGRLADGETVLPFSYGPGYTVYLEAFIDGYYIPVSNTLDFGQAVSQDRQQ